MRVQTGDRRAFDLLIKKYRCRIRRVISNLTRNTSDVDDVVQDTFMRAYCAIDRFRGDSSFYTWLYRIAINVSNTHHHRQITMSASTYSEDLDEDKQQSDYRLPLELDTPESLLRCKQLATALSKTLENIPLDFRLAFDLREMEGLSYEEIAGRMGCPVGTVRSRIFRAREILGDCLRSFGHAA